MRRIAQAGLLVSLVLLATTSQAFVVINFDDEVPGGGFPTHTAPVGHTYDSLGVHFENSLESDDPATANFRWASSTTDSTIRDNARGVSGEVGLT